jgi:uncharacterized membrane protein YjgN (DUF898 family)
MMSEQDCQPATAAPARDLRLEFRGNADEYFRIWIVNLCLTLLTFGVFSAWAKVRKKRYLYSHTFLDGTPFQYLGQPIPILKGRLVAAALFVAWWLSSYVFHKILPVTIAAGALLLPWVVVRTAAFRARYSAYRNITFGFGAGIGAAAKVLYFSPLLFGLVALLLVDISDHPYAVAVAAAVSGLAYPWWWIGLSRFIVRSSSYGGCAGEFGATGTRLFGVYLRAGFILLASAALAFAAAAAFLLGTRTGMVAMLIVQAVAMAAGWVLVLAYANARSANLIWNGIRCGPIRFASTLEPLGLARLYLGNTVAVVASLGVLSPWAVMRAMRYRVSRMRITLDGDWTGFRGSEATTVRAAGAEVGDLFDLELAI